MANRTITFQVFQRGKQDQLSFNAAELTVTNPSPELPTNVSIEAVFDTIFFGYTPPTDLDWKGILIWLSTNSGFNPNDQNKVYEGPDVLIPIGGLAANTTYYIRFATFDRFGKDGITTSSEFSVTTIEIIENQIADFAVTNAKIGNLSADKIIAGNIVADDIFLGEGTDFKLDGPAKQIFVKDEQTPSSVIRVKMGKLGPNPEDFGLEVFDENGDLVVGANGLGLNVVGELQLSTEVEERLSPPGGMMDFAGSAAPNGWLLCDGDTYDSIADTSLAALFAVIGITYGGTGASDFRVPDVRGRVGIGLDNLGGVPAGRMTDPNADVLGGAGGVEEVSLTEAQNGPHAHTGGVHTHTGPNHTHGGVVGSSGSQDRVGTTGLPQWTYFGSTAAAGTGATGSAGAVATTSSGSGLPHPNDQPWMAFTKIIKK